MNISNISRRPVAFRGARAWAVAALLGTAGAAQALTVSLSPTSATTPPATTQVTISVSGLTPGTAVGGFDLSVTYSPTVWSPAAITFGPYLGDPSPSALEAATQVDASTSGVVTLREVSYIGLFDPQTLAQIQPSSFALATVTFNAVRAGSGSFALTRAELVDAVGAALPVPEPSTPAMLAVGVWMVALGARRRQRSHPA